MCVYEAKNNNPLVRHTKLNLKVNRHSCRVSPCHDTLWFMLSTNCKLWSSCYLTSAFHCHRHWYFNGQMFAQQRLASCYVYVYVGHSFIVWTVSPRIFPAFLLLFHVLFTPRPKSCGVYEPCACWRQQTSVAAVEERGGGRVEENRGERRRATGDCWMWSRSCGPAKAVISSLLPHSFGLPPLLHPW